MKFTTAFALIFACLVASSAFFSMVEAGKKKKLLAAMLLGAALAKKPKILPLPLPLPLPVSVLKPMKILNEKSNSKFCKIL